jgi:hypothetical protein
MLNEGAALSGLLLLFASSAELCAMALLASMPNNIAQRDWLRRLDLLIV